MPDLDGPVYMVLAYQRLWAGYGIDGQACSSALRSTFAPGSWPPARVSREPIRGAAALPNQAGGGVPGGDAGALRRGAADVRQVNHGRELSVVLLRCLSRLAVACLEETLAHCCAALLTYARSITGGS